MRIRAAAQPRPSRGCHCVTPAEAVATVTPVAIVPPPHLQMCYESPFRCATRPSRDCHTSHDYPTFRDCHTSCHTSRGCHTSRDRHMRHNLSVSAWGRTCAPLPDLQALGFNCEFRTVSGLLERSLHIDSQRAKASSVTLAGPEYTGKGMPSPQHTAARCGITSLPLTATLLRRGGDWGVEPAERAMGLSSFLSFFHFQRSLGCSLKFRLLHTVT